MMDSYFPRWLANLSNQILNSLEDMVAHWRLALLVVASLWVVHLLNFLCGYHFNHWGIIPRRARGLVGIPLSPLLHANSGHLFFNSVPLVVLLSMFLANGWQFALYISVILIVVSGTLLWLIGQHGVHIGASSLIMGYIGYLLANAYFYPTLSTILIAGLVLLYFGNALFSIFPQANKNLSWTGHLAGLLSGVALGAYYPMRFANIL